MIEVTGNLWEYDGDAKVILTNMVVNSSGRLVMGGGIAREARERIPVIDLVWGQMIMNYGGDVVTVFEDNEYCLVQFPTKNHWRNPSDLDLIARSAARLEDITNHRGWERVVLPRPGCGLGGLRWEDVQGRLYWLDDRFHVISYE